MPSDGLEVHLILFMTGFRIWVRNLLPSSVRQKDPVISISVVKDHFYLHPFCQESKLIWAINTYVFLFGIQ